MSSSAFSASNITAGVLVNAIFAGVVVTSKLTRAWVERIHPSGRKLTLGLIWLLALFGNIVLYFYSGRWFPLFSTILLLIGFDLFWAQLQQFWQVGLIGADRHIRSGIDYVQSLDMCTNSLSFLGVGARKLTEHGTEFEQAIRRCNRPTRPIRFLLCRPDNELLRKAAQSAGQAIDEYDNHVRQSLKVIANCRNRRQWNIEVRFYDVPLPLFRLMFIDEWLCLASHYVFGEGDGSQWPQLHVRRSANERDVNSLYHPFQQYFDQLWAEATPWDFSEFIQEAQ